MMEEGEGRGWKEELGRKEIKASQKRWIREARKKG